ncbi:kynureninase [Natronosporangium hydrolyticum]|uniref:Kynureninase n=1 Tax=Natronosporangium hydrolyticum TaxID=2811111 RepID=A0A895Y8D2_9ACTN|nr:kynureninase [Natronosporangium hydrolyticum]QSB13984.1 kynureninase [Natronosporangium hydrolyticum]
MATRWERAQRLDEEDPLAHVRKHFALPDDVCYLDGNSLGALPRGVGDRVREVVDEGWGKQLIRGWDGAGWWEAPERIGDRIGGLLGAAAGQTVVGETTTVQIFNALVAAARLRPDRELIVTDSDHFPTDRYLAASVARMLGKRLLLVPVAEAPALLRERAAEIAVLALPAVDFRTGELWPLRELTAEAHGAGAVVMWDLCHAVGAMPVDLDAAEVDVAVGCSYKFLSGGPGAPAFIYVAERHHSRLDLPLTGWTGHAEPFAMAAEYQPAPGIARARVGTPHVLSLLALEAALAVFDLVELAAVRAKSVALGNFLIECAESELVPLGFEVVTPCDESRRGSQVTLRHPQAYELVRLLAGRGVIGDSRPPNLLRFGLNALYVSYQDVHRAVQELAALAR